MDVKVFTEDGALELAEKLLQNDKDIKEELEQKGYATESFVTEKIAEAQLTDKEVDLSGYAKTEDLDDYATKEHSHDEYLTEHQDLSDYALKNEIPSLDGYAKTEDIPTSLPASDVYEWAKTETKPTYTASEVGALPDTTEIPSIDGLVSEERLSVALSPYAKTADIVEYDDTELVNKISATQNELETKVNQVDFNELSSNVVYIGKSNDEVGTVDTILTTQNIVDNVNSSLGNMVLSAKQGKVLNERISNIIAHNNETDGNTELLDIRIDANGDTHSSAGESVRSQINMINSEIGYLDKTLKNGEGFIILKGDDLEIGKCRDIYNGNIIVFSAGIMSKNLYPITSKCIQVGQNCTIQCFDESQNFIRSTSPLVQGNIRIAYVTDEVKYIAFNALITDEVIIYREIEMVFPFKKTEVDYYWASNNQVSCEKADLYEFDYTLMNIPIYATPYLTIGNQNTNKSIGGDGFVFFTSDTPYFTIGVSDGQNLWWNSPCIQPNQLRICCYGTSITADGSGKYPKYLKGMLKQNNLTVKGYGNGKYTNEVKGVILADAGNYDIAILEGCANDWWYSQSFEDLENSIHDIMENLTPRASKVFFAIDHTNRNWSTYQGGARHKINGYTSREYYAKCAEMFSAYGVTVIDAGMLSGINEFESEMYVDQIHHSEQGGYAFAEAIANELKRLGAV